MLSRAHNSRESIRLTVMSQLIISALGPDRPGIVGELTGHLHSEGGNILDSRMVNLRGEFAIMILLECAQDAATKLATELPQIGAKMKLKMTVTPQETATTVRSGIPYRLKTYSMDQPGIVARLTGVLRSLGVNIEELTARQDSAPFAGSPLFVTEMMITVPPNVALSKVRAELESAGNEMNCDVDLDPV
jgi:glycine cleavage system transcriptional repressor